MFKRSLIVISTVAAALCGIVAASAQPMMPPPPGQPGINREAELIGMHQLCDRGDRQACIRFGFMLGQNQERHVEWRRLHPEWWAWDHR
jgi:hypothetical protein